MMTRSKVLIHFHSPTLHAHPASLPLLRLDRVIPLREMPLPLLLLLRHPAGLLLGERAALGAGELGPQVEGQVLLLLVEDAELVALVGVDDGEDAGDVFADVVTAGKSSISMLLRLPRGRGCVRV